jgi:hypothetical protein
MIKGHVDSDLELGTSNDLINLPALLGDNGIDVGFHEVKTLNDGTLAYKGYRVLLYIRDVASYGFEDSMPRFHLAFCQTLERMELDNRFQRYVVANRDDGVFSVNFIKRIVSTEKIRLNVCQHCLGRLRWDGFQNNMEEVARIRVVKKFQLKTFFKRYPKDLIPKRPDHTSDDAPLNDYTNDWEAVSERTKKARGHRCENPDCSLLISRRDSKYLHVHHENGLKYDNSERNLTVLCIRCHADQPQHGHMKKLPDYLAFIAKYPRYNTPS